MSVTNHTIRPEYNVQLAMIKGTEIVAFCGRRMIPTVQVGTSGRADRPGAPQCEACVEGERICFEWSRLKDEKNRLAREMRAMEKAFRALQNAQREIREKVPA